MAYCCQDISCTLCDVRCFLGVIATQRQSHLKSSDETVAEDLLDKFNIKEQGGWALLGGNGIAYQDLLNIKKQYTVAFQKLIVFPGDWHTLKSYQPVLMKVYYHAGLKELEQKAVVFALQLLNLWSAAEFQENILFSATSV